MGIEPTIAKVVEEETWLPIDYTQSHVKSFINPVYGFFYILNALSATVPFYTSSTQKMFI